MNQISQLFPPKCENIIKVRGEIRLPEGNVFYPQWKTSGSNPVYGGYQDACETLVYDTKTFDVITHKSGKSFPLGQHIKPIKVLTRSSIYKAPPLLTLPAFTDLTGKLEN